MFSLVDFTYDEENVESVVWFSKAGCESKLFSLRLLVPTFHGETEERLTSVVSLDGAC